MRIALLKIKGMTCEGCAYTVRRAIESLEGVKRAKVSLIDHTALVEYDPSKISINEIIKAVEESGYGASI